LARAVLETGRGRIALHVRGPGLAGRTLWARVRELVEPATRAGAALVVNDRVDLALVLPIWGVQLRESSLPVAEARRLLAGKARVGASVHGVERAEEAARGGADWLVVGTVFATPRHPDRPGAGPGLLAEIGACCRLPLVAIGGVTPDRVEAVLEAGAHGVAVSSGVWGAPHPAAAVDAYLRALG